MNPNWQRVNGTIMFEPPAEMTYAEMMEVVRIITNATGVEGGYDSSFTLSGDLMFFHINDDEARQIESGMHDLFGDALYDRMNFIYDTDFDDEEDEDQRTLGTVCAGCWQIIPNGGEVFLIDDEPYCAQCYERIEGFQ